MDENLVGYLLRGARSRDPAGSRNRACRAPGTAARLELLRRGLAPLADDADEVEPPPGLVLGTIARIAEHRCRSLPAAPPPTPHQRFPRRRLPRRSDLLVAACLLILVGGVLAPAVAAPVADLRVPGRLRQQHAPDLERSARLQRSSRGRIPRLAKDGPRSVAGIFVPVLQEAGVALPEANLVCPGEANRTRPGHNLLRNLEDLYARDRAEYDRVVRELAGSYAYSLGYQDGDEIKQVRRNSDDGLPILADRLPCGAPGNSPNHDGSGQNVLHVGGHVTWCTQRTVGLGGDDIYLNRNNQARAGSTATTRSWAAATSPLARRPTTDFRGRPAQVSHVCGRMSLHSRREYPQ